MASLRPQAVARSVGQVRGKCLWPRRRRLRSSAIDLGPPGVRSGGGQSGEANPETSVRAVRVAYIAHRRGGVSRISIEVSKARVRRCGHARTRRAVRERLDAARAQPHARLMRPWKAARRQVAQLVFSDELWWLARGLKGKDASRWRRATAVALIAKHRGHRHCAT